MEKGSSVEKQAPDFWRDAPPEAQRAMDLLARRILERRIRLMREREEADRDGSSDK